jgi:hypothetical protein
MKGDYLIFFSLSTLFQNKAGACVLTELKCRNGKNLKTKKYKCKKYYMKVSFLKILLFPKILATLFQAKVDYSQL